MRWLSLLAAFTVISCDRPAPPEAVMAAEEPVGVPDESYRLDPAVRAQLQVAFDTDALEDILASYPNPADRDKSLKEFLELADRSARGEIVITGFGAIAERPEIHEAASRIMRHIQAVQNGAAPPSSAKHDQ